MDSRQNKKEGQLFGAVETQDSAIILTWIEQLGATYGYGAIAANKDAENGLISAVIEGIEGNVATALELIANKIYVDGMLIMAAKYGHTAAVSTLIAAGANVNATSSSGMTPLMFAAFNGHTAIVSTLIAYGANVNAVNAEKNDNNTALILAAGHDRSHATTTVSVLMAAHANVNAVNIHGQTALDMACSFDNKNSVFKLLSSMSFQNISAILIHRCAAYFKNNDRLTSFVIQYKQEVFNIQQTIFYALSFFSAPNRDSLNARSSVNRILLDTETSLPMMLSYLVPEWYRDHLNSDVTSFSTRLMRMFKNPAATAPAISTSALTSAVVPYLPGAARHGRRSEEEGQNNKVPSKKVRPD